jgi:ABC-2 type transport system ATP-binding protein
MNREYVVELERVTKTFRTWHFLYKDEDTQKRSLYYRRTVTAANRISFGVARGEIFGLLGPNGAGKTTTVKMISGLIRPDAGRVYVDGLHVESKRLQVLKRVGVVLEGTRTSIWPLTPLENLMYYGNLKNVRGKVLRTRARELLDFIGLKDKMHIQTRKLSRGEKQKLAICIALVADPPVLLLDEPTTGLDVQSSRNIRDKILDVTSGQGKSALVTTHDMHVAQELCDRIGIINKGELVACKRTEELLNLFSDQSFEFHVDRLPVVSEFADIPGVRNVTPLLKDGDEPVLVVQVDSDRALRSEALYGMVARLKQRGYVLHSFNERQQSLENVFLHVTSGAGQGQKRNVGN